MQNQMATEIEHQHRDQQGHGKADTSGQGPDGAVALPLVADKKEQGAEQAHHRAKEQNENQGFHPHVRQSSTIRWSLVILTLAGTLLTAALSVWQWQRAGEKQALLDAVANAPERVLVRLSEADALPVWARVRVEGIAYPALWLLDNRTVEGKVGYDVLMLVCDAHEDCIWVNRGWVAGSRDRRVWPELPAPGGDKVLTGTWRPWPAGEAAGLEIRSPGLARIQHLNDARVPDGLRVSRAGLLQLNATSPEALTVHWQPVILSPERHIGYAVQWALLSVALLMTGLTTIKRTHP